MGLILDFIGVILLFYFGLPSKIKEHGGSILIEESNADELIRNRSEKFIKKVANFAFVLIIIGFFLQVISASIGYSDEKYYNHI